MIKHLACLGLLLSLAKPDGQSPVQRPPAPPGSTETSAGSRIVSPSVLASYSLRREPGGVPRVDILILWRGSPGWFFRRTAAPSFMSGPANSPGDPTRTFQLQQGGLALNATFDPASGTVRTLGQTVDLKGANVVLMDDVDAPSGPRVVKTILAGPDLAAIDQLHKLILKTPELLDYLRCHAQLSSPGNTVAMNFVCAEAMATGTVKLAVTTTPIPEGPVQNSAAAPQPQGVPGPRGLSQGFGGTSQHSEGLRPVSAVTASNWLGHRGASGAMEVDLLVLWRGTPGWFLKPGGGGGSTSGTSSGVQSVTMTMGGVSLSLRYDAAARSARIHNSDVPLGDANVVLVDEVDSPTGPKVLKTLRIDPVLEGERPMIERAIGRSPELIAFVRCDVTLPNANQQAMIDIFCGRIQGK